MDRLYESYYDQKYTPNYITIIENHTLINHKLKYDIYTRCVCSFYYTYILNIIITYWILRGLPTKNAFTYYYKKTKVINFIKQIIISTYACFSPLT